MATKQEPVRQYVILEFTLEHPVSELADKVAGRGHTIQGVASCTPITPAEYLARIAEALPGG